MIEWGALALAVVKLIASILDARQASAPQRAEAQLEKDYDRDIHQAQQAAATRDPATLTMDFEAERQSAVRRGDFDPSPPGQLP